MSDLGTLTDEQPVHPDDEMLTAYLDGELTNAERDEVENRLINEEAFRSRLQQLQSSWDWLSQLPSEAPSEKLMQSTIELVISDIAPPKKESPNWFSAHRSGLLTLVLALGCLLAGFVVSKEVERRRTVAEVGDLAIAEDLEALLLGGDFQLMRELDASVSWKMMISTYEDISGLQLTPEELIASTPVAERESAIAEMTPLERATLEGQWKAFQALDDQSEAKVRATAKTLRQQPDSDALIQTMRIYSKWRESLPPEMRQELEASEGIKRREAIENAVAYSLGKLSDDSGDIISDETEARIWFQLQRLLQKRLDADPELVEFRDRFESLVGKDRVEAPMISMMVFRRDVRRESGRRGRFGPGPPIGTVIPPALTDEELFETIEILDDEAIATLNALTNWNPYSGRDPHLVSIAMQAWAEETTRRKTWKREERLSENWIQRYEKSDDRDVLDLLPPSEIKRRMLLQQNWFRRSE